MATTAQVRGRTARFAQGIEFVAGTGGVHCRRGFCILSSRVVPCSSPSCCSLVLSLDRERAEHATWRRGPALIAEMRIVIA
jgi:hypothetical protein